MQYNQGPNIIETYPSNYSTGVPVDVKITAKFDMDVAKSSIAGNIHLYDRHGKEVDARFSYDNRTVTIIPREVLQGSATYRVVFLGDNNPENTIKKVGICTPLNHYMLGDYSITFSTYSNDERIEEIINGSPNNIMITSQPIIKFDTTGKIDNPVVSVQVQISHSKSFDKSVCDSIIGFQTIEEEGYKPSVALADGLYYWRARVKDQSKDGNWSDTFTFNINTIEQLPVVDEDTVIMDLSFPDEWNMTEPSIVNIFPLDNAALVPLNLKTVAIVVDQILPSELIYEDMLTITGTSVDGDDTVAEHGVVAGMFNVAYDYAESTTTLLFSLSDIEGTDN